MKFRRSNASDPGTDETARGGKGFRGVHPIGSRVGLGFGAVVLVLLVTITLTLRSLGGLAEVLQEDFGIEPAALLVLHTWDQRLEHHPHIHALVPGGGPTSDRRRWKTTRHKKHRRRKKPYLTEKASRMHHTLEPASV